MWLVPVIKLFLIFVIVIAVFMMFFVFSKKREPEEQKTIQQGNENKKTKERDEWEFLHSPGAEEINDPALAPTNEDTPYKKAASLLTTTEGKFHYVLGLVIQDKYVIQSKVGLKDIVKLKNKDDMTNFNRIAKKHLDFVICNKRYLEPLCAIELDDRTHRWASSKKRDAVKDEVMQMAGIPLYRFKVQPYYDQGMIKERLRKSLSDI